MTLNLLLNFELSWVKYLLFEQANCNFFLNITTIRQNRVWSGCRIFKSILDLSWVRRITSRSHWFQNGVGGCTSIAVVGDIICPGYIKASKPYGCQCTRICQTYTAVVVAGSSVAYRAPTLCCVDSVLQAPSNTSFILSQRIQFSWDHSQECQVH